MSDTALTPVDLGTVERVVAVGDLSKLSAEERAKRCLGCGLTKPSYEFYVSTRTADGLRSRCRRCHCAQTVATRRRRKPPQPRLSMIERFAAKTERGEGCWLWRGARTGNGYGLFRVEGTVPEYAHRVSYRLHVGPIPEGLHLDHLCCNPWCVNPSHLEPVTREENLRRGKERRGV